MASYDVGSSTEQASVKGVLVTSKDEAKEGQDQLALLQLRHDKLGGILCKDSDKVQDDWKDKIEAFHGKAVEAVNILDKMRLTEYERLEKFFRERDAAKAFLLKVGAALRRLSRLRKS